MGDRPPRSWNAGRLDSLTRLSWNDGIVNPAAAQTGISITETIGGDDVSDVLRFRVNRTTQVRVQTEGAIAELVQNNAVVIGANDGYSSDLTATLNRGTYYLHFSTESSTPDLFHSRVTVV